jgi:hypothetical protein
MSLFDPKAYGPALEALIASARAPALGLEAPNENARPLLERLSVAQSFPGPPADEAMAETCLAALWLRQGFGETCHRMVQGLPTPTGNYWHGIYHRRESDFTNSKHWFRRAGAHPILTPLREAVCDLSQKDGTGARVGELAGLEQWDPERFVDACAAARERGGQDEADGVDYHFRPPAKIEALGRKEGYVKVDVRGDLQALEIASIQRAMDAGYDAFFEGNPFVPAKLREAGVPERFETLSVFLAPLSRDEINFLTAPERRVDLGSALINH